MGCTSSAQNTLPPATNTADKSIQFEEETNESPSIEVDAADIEDENRTNETKVLPSCDNTDQSVQLVRHNKSTSSFTIEKDVPANGHVIESEEVTAPENPQDEVKIPKLELLIEKVFETNHHLNGEHKLNDIKTDEDNPQTETNKEAEPTIDNNNETLDTKAESEANNNDENEDEKKDEGGEEEAEDASPSQSQSSRATRWEALADIAAELPPSLAVDPITGQIYQIALPK